MAESSSRRTGTVHARAIRDALRIELSLLSPVAGAITALPVALVFAVGLSIGTTSGAIAMAIGANLIAIVSLVGAPRLSLRLALVDALLLGISVYVGTISGSVTWLHIAILVPWCFSAGMLDVFGQTSATVGSQAVIAYVVLGRFIGSSLFALHLSLFVVAGASVEIVALVLLRFPPSLRYQRRRISLALEALSQLALQDPSSAATTALAALDDANEVLSASSLFGRVDAAELRAILDQARRTRLQLTTLAGLRVRLRDTLSSDNDQLITSTLRPLASSLVAMSNTLQQQKNANWLENVRGFDSQLLIVETMIEGRHDEDVTLLQCVAHLRALGGQIRAMGKLVDSSSTSSQRRVWRPSRPQFIGFEFSQLRSNLRIVRDNVTATSPSFRHAVRLAIAVPFAAVIGSALSLPRSFWLAFAVAVILKPDYSSLLHRGLSRIVGTIIGAVVAALVIGGLHPGHATTTVLIVLSAWIAYSTWSASFAVSFGFVTALVLMALSITTTDTLSTALDRLLDFSLGGVIAVLAYLVWPTSPQVELKDVWTRLYESLAAYLVVVFDVITSTIIANESVVEKSRAVRMSWVSAEAAVGRAVEEPATFGFNASMARGQLVATMRILRSLHALRVEGESGVRVERNDQLKDLETACHETLTVLAGAPATREEVPDLRALFVQVERTLRDQAAPLSVPVHLDELVNAINTAYHMTRSVPTGLPGT